MKFLIVIFSLVYISMASCTTDQSLQCNLLGFYPASVTRIEEGIKKLRDTAFCASEAEACRVVSCISNNAIILCNEGSKNINIGCDDVADKAAEIVEHCKTGYEGAYEVQGRVGGVGDYYVVVEAAEC